MVGAVQSRCRKTCISHVRCNRGGGGPRQRYMTQVFGGMNQNEAPGEESGMNNDDVVVPMCMFSFCLHCRCTVFEPGVQEPHSHDPPE